YTVSSWPYTTLFRSTGPQDEGAAGAREETGRYRAVRVESGRLQASSRRVRHQTGRDGSVLDRPEAGGDLARDRLARVQIVRPPGGAGPVHRIRGGSSGAREVEVFVVGAAEAR